MIEKYDPDDDRAMLETIVDSLDESLEHLDGHTLSRLNQARQRALTQTARPQLFNAQWVKAGAIAALIFTLVNGWMMFSTPNIQQMQTDEFELIVVNDDFDLMQDIDFIAWMIEQEHAS